MPLMHAFVERSCHDAGFQPRVRQVATGLRTHLFLAGAGAGVAIVPRQGVTGETRSDVALVPIRDVELRIPAALAHAPDNRNRLIGGFMKAAEDIN
jgi:DNA-binding transcriptional LysR family regulator